MMSLHKTPPQLITTMINMALRYVIGYGMGRALVLAMSRILCLMLNPKYSSFSF